MTIEEQPGNSLPSRLNNWLDQPLSRRDIVVGIFAALGITAIGGSALVRTLRDLGNRPKASEYRSYTEEDEKYLLKLIANCNELKDLLINPLLVSKYQIEVSRTGYSGRDVFDLKYRRQNINLTGWSSVGYGATMNLADRKRYAAIFYSYFDENTEVFLSHVNFNIHFLEIPELTDFQLPPSKTLGIRYIDPQFYKEAASAILRIPPEAEWSNLVNSRFEAKFNLASTYPTRVRPDWTGLPKVEVAFNQRGIKYRKEHKEDKYYFQ